MRSWKTVCGRITRHLSAVFSPLPLSADTTQFCGVVGLANTAICVVYIIGGHSVRYPWSAISDWAWYRNVRCRTEECRVRHYIGYRNKFLSDIRYPTSTSVYPRSAVVDCQIHVMKVISSKSERKLISQFNLLGTLGNDSSILDIGISDIDLVRYRNVSWCRYRNYSDIGMKGFSPTFFVPISE
jgi:hypothetical protein